jgi:hypothetical protein
MSGLDEHVGRLAQTHARMLFASSTPLMLLNHAGIPYELSHELGAKGLHQLRPAGGSPTLSWVSAPAGRAVTATIVGADPDSTIPVFARVMSDGQLEPLLSRCGGSWRRARVLTSADGSAVGSIWQEQDGSVLLPFDPDEVLLNYLSERYLRIGPGAGLRDLRRRLRLGYYRARPLLPRQLQIWLRRHFALVQARSQFPRWPIETCVHDFLRLMFAILSGIAGEPLPRIADWPGGHSWALVLTHDVEDAAGLAAIEPVLELERAHGIRSCWNFVPRRYEIDAATVVGLLEDGFEVGVHGLHHDGRDLESSARWQERLPAAHDAARRWQAVGFRSASLHREWEWMRNLAFDYDSSYPDTDPFEPQEGGCCTWLPFFNGDIVELPLTLSQDHTLFVILGHRDETAWTEKAQFLRERGGLAMIDTHPDYMIDRRIFDAYGRFLARFANDDTAWRALPREVSSWWRRRAASHLEHNGEAWEIVGPAAGEGRVIFEAASW